MLFGIMKYFTHPKTSLFASEASACMSCTKSLRKHAQLRLLLVGRVADGLGLTCAGGQGSAENVDQVRRPERRADRAASLA